MSVYLPKKSVFAHYISSGAIEVCLFYSFIALGGLASPLVAYLTSDWILTIAPMMLFLLLVIPTGRGILAEEVVHVLFFVLSKWDDFIGVKTDIKAGLVLFSGMLIGLALNIFSTLFSLIGIAVFS